MNLKKVLLIVGIVVLIVVLIVVIISLIVAHYEDRYVTSPQKVLEPEGYYVYYPQSAKLKRDELSIITPKGQYVSVVDIGKNLTVTIDPEYEGTVLVVKHWADKVRSHADLAEIVVQTEECKNTWEERIKQVLEKYHKQLEKPRDVLPECY
jgi:flagellar basal body-associated protein FliL